MPILILGATARAAAGSARRAGLSPVAADLFADRDLRSLGPAVRVPAVDYPEGLAAAADAPPASPWIYTGGLENYPDLVERIARRRPLWGNGAAALRAVRDPIAVATALRRAGLPAPAARLDPAGLPRDGSWLAKPLASAGGRGIAPLGRETSLDETPRYYQERLAGTSLGAVFVADRGGRRAGAGPGWRGSRGNGSGPPGGGSPMRGASGRGRSPRRCGRGSMR